MESGLSSDLRVAVTRSAAETQRLGERIGAAARDGDVVCLFGELGAGKTTLAQGIARGLDIPRRVTSPTFTLVQEYDGRIRLYHMDCYRMEGAEDLETLDVEDWIGRDGLVVIEWPERILSALPADRLDLRLTIEDESRRIVFQSGGPKSDRLLGGALG
jgi:tRNA threonylcarbamoyladenosine biosynthesis protein TsaE